MVLVSVWITTYNHEAFIAQAIEGVLMQKTNFAYELIIGEDCSTDSTRQIVKKYKEQYPDKIKLFLPEYNIGMIPMFRATYSLCTGKYIAWLDGDDYWTDPNKLQYQVDFLEANPDFVLSFHKVRVQDMLQNRTWESADPLNGLGTVLAVENFLEINNPIDTPSVVHRNVLNQQLPDWFFNLPYLDLGFYFLLLQHGKIKYHHAVMCVYRIHKGGAWSGTQVYQQHTQMISFNTLLLHHLTYLNSNPVYKNKIKENICLLNFSLIEMDIQAHALSKAKEKLRFVFPHTAILLKHRKKRMLKLIILLFLKAFSLKSFLRPLHMLN